ncbi:bifunctional D-glycero-beta-D-manno-heptose-7-phosphate kinase/D-glycero-beta-D-manno-heptose 1-phosphate adenylyltransferase HldE [Alcanivorax sp. JB21]|uniref:bifunctional D-glycero-beta-D-manno-heptose-7-phosphate kinase/D-glycero-beta-D-manno-heptose 1-phosphate adenylyltransferase HldE n=1 Tax=Alcanivorax limicola TaxID=2874102 RepID=UPI001CBB8460|nr:bifunctional D-glycero-beta-D-manno-heptose-7-phosphate kinase/D-glycero-beta-D-manno-heptose 1-phosphate adenylyltransferase HldE [Alcanivorax limicola]MBZ2190296.1 bifunctional D-glycero-beta-D-manno-heptose-7-phosphate kinase/D-glycero-beta-D-manno-heptose 1-phosphate adenylyltransferase HldE [Alcanivorax limicola]
MLDPTQLYSLRAASVLVVGDVMLDRYLAGDSERISPEAPVPVVHVSNTEDRAGGAANVARNIAHLDGRVGLLGLIGDDRNGASLMEILKAEHIRSELILEPKQQTTAKIRVISRKQQVVRLDMESPCSEAASARLADRFETLLDDYNTILFSDYNKESLRYVKRMIQAARKAGKTVLVDPKQADFSVYRGADVITPNLTEFHVAGGVSGNETEMLASARAILARAGIKAMLLTRSEAGMSLITSDEHHYFPAEVREVSDVTGAGDTVIGTLAVMLGANVALPDAAELANLAAGIVVGKLGAGTVSPQELGGRLCQTWTGRNATYRPTSSQSLQHIEYARFRGERIVFTNGCFDMLHAGHVRYLTQARALGDRLVVGLNVDASVRRLKGDSRPINNLEDRMEVLRALACVDWVLPFGEDPAEEDTPAALIRQVCPQVLVKGGDYTLATIVGADFVQARGGEVHVLPLVEGRSTTNIISRMGG